MAARLSQPGTERDCRLGRRLPARVRRGAVEEVSAQISRGFGRQHSDDRSVRNRGRFLRRDLPIPRRLDCRSFWSPARALFFLALACAGYLVYLIGPTWPFAFLGL